VVGINEVELTTELCALIVVVVSLEQETKSIKSKKE
jgi:hypothetical protein